MENASKALIIAGAILLSILIISLGIMVYQNAKNTVGSANLSKQEIQTFNSQWETYIGDNKTASEVRTMIQAVIANNAAEKKSGENRTVKVKGADVTSVPTMDNSKRYTMEVEYDTTSGLVNNIKWTVMGTTTTTPTPTPTP